MQFLIFTRYLRFKYNPKQLKKMTAPKFSTRVFLRRSLVSLLILIAMLVSVYVFAKAK